MVSSVPRTVEEWCAWAQFERGQGRTERAKAGFRQALAADPASLPARFALASLLLDLGDVQGAARLAEEMASLAVGRPEVLWTQARVDVARGNAAGARETLMQLVRGPHLSAAQAAEAWLLLGSALGELDRSAEAFAAAAHGKRLQRALHAPDASSREGEVAKLRRLTRWFDTALPASAAPQPSPVPGAAASHVFLLGFPRSGTTLLEQVLAAHPDVRALEEEPTLAAAYQAFLSDEKACAALDGLAGDEAAAWASHYWHGVRARIPDVAGKLFVDKQPAGTLYLPLIARLFPHARILFALRDPRDVVLSCYRQAFRMNAMTYCFTDLAETAACYDACMTLAEAARTRLPLAWTDVRHEALVEDFAGELGRIATFLDLTLHDGMAEFAGAARARPIRTPSAPQVRAGLNRRGIGRWRRYADELAPVLPSLAPWVRRFGYSD